MSEQTVYFCLSIDCEATQPEYADPALGERGAAGLAEILEAENLRGVFFALPSDLEASPDLYRRLHDAGHEVGLHVHPATEGNEEFWGVYGPQDQRRLLSEASDRFLQVMQQAPRAFCPGYYSANDHTYPLLVEAGFTHGRCSHPGRVLPQCASTWAGAPLFAHYAHPHHRILAGDLDFVEIPVTIDWDSHMWGGALTQDLRVELVDAKNHFYTMHKSLDRQREEGTPILLLHAMTHNFFEYGDPRDFRRETLQGIIRHARRLAEEESLELQGGTLAELAATYRLRVPRQKLALELDRRGHLGKEK
jgi:peptidoglycan/xylan/chitin deacetylase (PgdA/CDA1 family)